MPLLIKPIKPFKNYTERGFSLIEVMMAVFIFCVGVLAIALMLDTSIQHNASARFISEATEIAQYQMEKLMSASYNDADLDESLSPYGPNNVANYTVSWTVRDNVPMSAMKTINLSVAWNDRGADQSITVDSIKQ